MTKSSGPKNSAGQVELQNLTVQYDGFTAISEISLNINQGEFFSFLGPSGCGKTTVLRSIAGFVEPASGVVRIGGRDMRGVGPNRRPTALVFQSLALFPTMSVAENIEYGLRVRRVDKSARRARTAELLELVALPDKSNSRIDKLSGGQRQRVAIARALAVEPSVLLLDEPLSALDLKLRQHMRKELRAIQQKVGTTFVYITHDQGEALALSDRIAVMQAGRVAQVGAGHTVYQRPESAFVAAFMGETNALPGRVIGTESGEGVVETRLGRFRGLNERGLAVGDDAILFVRPEALQADVPDVENCLQGRVHGIVYEGVSSELSFYTADGHKFSALLSSRQASVPEQGELVRFGFRASDAVLLPPR
jgi:spermidine/putrescine transport system ATP-binding protein